MWCPTCEMKTNEPVCTVCQQKTVEDIEIPIEVYWCNECSTPVIMSRDDVKSCLINNKPVVCPVCSCNMAYLATDIRPVFPEERLLLELLENREIFSLQKANVWAHENKYYIDGKKHIVSLKKFEDADISYLQQGIEANKLKVSYDEFNVQIDRFIKYNRKRFNNIKYVNNC